MFLNKLEYLFQRNIVRKAGCNDFILYSSRCLDGRN